MVRLRPMIPEAAEGEAQKVLVSSAEFVTDTRMGLFRKFVSGVQSSFRGQMAHGKLDILASNHSRK